MKPVFRLWGILVLSLLLATASGFVTSSYAGDAGDPKAKTAEKAAAKKAKDAPAAKSGPSAKAAEKAESSAAKAAPRSPAPAPKPQGPRGAGAMGEREWPEWRPMPTTRGTLGFFTVETGDTLPKKSLSFASYLNKFSRSPGDATILSLGWNIGFGLTDWWSVYLQFEPHRHIHMGRPHQLSFNAPIGNPGFGNTFYRVLTPGGLPGYIEDYPFAARRGGGRGEVMAGTKWSMFSEFRGDPFSLSVRNDFYFPTTSGLTDLVNNQTQSGQFNYEIGLAASRTWGETFQAAFNYSHRFTRDPRSGGQKLMRMSDQTYLNFGWLLFPYKRVQFLHEVNSLLLTGSATPNTVRGAKDTVDSVAGLRLYPFQNLALDLGFRQTFNKKFHGDQYGFVIKLSSVYWTEKPKPVNRSPLASCTADKTSLYVGSGDMVRVTVQASDPDGDSLSYNWSATGGRIEGSGTEVRWNSAGTAAGSYTVTVRVDDGQGGTASCAVDVRVEPRPNRAPTMSCSADRSSVIVGERVRITATASDPDGDTLTYSWRTNGGQIVGQGASVQLDTTGVNPGRYTVTGRVDDGKGGAADCNVTVTANAPPVQPQAVKLNECTFRAKNSARVDNVCKRVLDDVALRLQSEPRARIVVIGYADPGERRPDQLSAQRAAEAKKYLESKGIAGNRIETRTAAGQAGADQANRRVEIIWVPEGASY